MGHDSSKFRITESVFRFGADVRAGDDPREAQRRLIRDGEAMPIENHLQLNDETERESAGQWRGRIMIERGKISLANAD
ncbi:condesin subunit E [Salmonella enterica subsp. enterica]|uniref:Condesin subunit E n=1 Tax=Salmonella enterica I TaxID=59201 RepID=A0A3S4LXG2_SALET|nr:condesin subunit E [Salmonella enterica subsp. enterica]